MLGYFGCPVPDDVPRVVIDQSRHPTRRWRVARFQLRGGRSPSHWPFKKPKDGQLTVDQQAYNAIHGALRCLGERANSLLKTTYKNVRRYRGCPWRLGDVAAAALVLLHHEHHRTT
ncbi:transposase family protein [Amycolatopsis sp. DG1A-15b]|uniref:transposase family protein n=1 Tax=Amycolatopsis sp. DG1A-15b TaxID=3052846 RepID=UPI00255BD382|nr:transposase family protein [Amycolatopsis sp. DG1A-15b]WIX91417.1 transposase family protein [Amycolatopsis sp. DG1A-15b]